jgi:AAA domain-containing protein
VSIIINLYGGPGTGKSTSAAYLFYLAKHSNINAELVREYVKEWAWEGRTPGPFDQLYFLGKQARKESMLYGKADLIITDSPVALCTYYSSKFGPKGLADGIALAVHEFYRDAQAMGHTHVHVWLNRSKPYNPLGRFQTADEAVEMDKEIRPLLANVKGLIRTCDTDDVSLAALFREISKL